MAKLAESSNAYVLHTRPFTDTKQVVTFFTRSHGRLSCIARVTKKSPPLQSFTRYELSFSGAGALKTLRCADAVTRVNLSPGRPTFCGMYLNELLMRLLPELEEHDVLQNAYQATLMKLVAANEDKLQEVLLRRFEFALLDELGLGINFQFCREFQPIGLSDECLFSFTPNDGFIRHEETRNQREQVGDRGARYFSAKTLTDIQNENWNHEALRAAKLISRLAFRPLLGNKPIKARELFQ